MKIEQIYTGCLAQGAYYISDGGEAVIIDPLRETQPYMEKAEKAGDKIKYIFETHFHADFVSGHVDLAAKTGATIVYGPGAKTEYDIHEGEDGEQFQVGNVSFELLHTPGHTLESSCFLLRDENENPHSLFTGDTLFIGDVGRPDLAVKSDLTKEDLAALLYDSLRQKVITLPDHVVIFPAHGAGSACGKNMSNETSDTLGNQKAINYALNDTMSKEDFIREVTQGILPPPQYFAKNAAINKTGYDSLDTVLDRGIKGLNPDEFEAAANQYGALVLDTRKPVEFTKAHIPNSIFIGLDGSFAPWVGALITDLKQPILLIVEEGREEEAITRLARVGYDYTIGFLQGGVAGWVAAGKDVEELESIEASELLDRMDSNLKMKILDVRKPSEFEAGHIPDAENVPLDFINNDMIKLHQDEPYHIHCAGGYRSVIFASILQSRGFTKLTDIKGGYKAIKEAGITVA
ncbi:MAG: MBL fold metallo-hydrolase [Cyclobacteriaceae bacterium]|nr:MBL fold metallo-hydrolase [Cyclobacteriaceae bacterium HetDA_MAG_MS6]